MSCDCGANADTGTHRSTSASVEVGSHLGKLFVDLVSVCSLPRMFLLYSTLKSPAVPALTESTTWPSIVLSFCLCLCGLWIQIMSMLRKVGLATLGQQYGHDEPCRLRASDKHLQRLRQVASCQAAPSLPKSSSSLVGRPVLGRRGLAMRRCGWRWTGRGPL